MSDVDLLMFGCVVTFIGVAGAYVYIRESFTAGVESPRLAEASRVDAVKDEVSKVARRRPGLGEQVGREAG